MSAMTSTGARAGRGPLARLVVVAVLAGLALMMGVQCSDGMSIATPVSHSTTMAMPLGEHEHESGMGMGMGMGESLTMCLVLVVAVAVAAVVLTLPAVRAT